MNPARAISHRRAFFVQFELDATHVGLHAGNLLDARVAAVLCGSTLTNCLGIRDVELVSSQTIDLADERGNMRSCRAAAATLLLGSVSAMKTEKTCIRPSHQQTP
jgi:hypothetical protein